MGSYMWIVRIRTFHELSYLDDRGLYGAGSQYFAAEFLVDDTDLFDTLQSHTDFFSVASSLNVPPELLDFKLRLLEKRDGGSRPHILRSLISCGETSASRSAEGHGRGGGV